MAEAKHITMHSQVAVMWITVSLTGTLRCSQGEVEVARHCKGMCHSNLKQAASQELPQADTVLALNLNNWLGAVIRLHVHKDPTGKTAQVDASTAAVRQTFK